MYCFLTSHGPATSVHVESMPSAKIDLECNNRRKDSLDMYEEAENLDKSRDVLQEHAKLCECIRGTHTASRECSPDGGRGEATS